LLCLLMLRICFFAFIVVSLLLPVSRFMWPIIT
jgi:hypothetical protein